MTGIGPVAVRQPRVRDREAVGGERIRFSPTILPPYARRTKSLEVLIPILYLDALASSFDRGIIGVGTLLLLNCESMEVPSWRRCAKSLDCS